MLNNLFLRPSWFPFAVLVWLLSGVKGISEQTASSIPDPTGPAIRFSSQPAVSPDGATVVFSWRRDLWSAPVEGGRAVRLTSHPSTDSFPLFSPDGQTLFFGSFRDGPRHLYSMPAGGGPITRLSHHSTGLTPETVYPDGSRVVFRALRDHPGFQPRRLFTLPADRHDGAETLLFDVDANSVSIHPNGNRLLLVRNSAQGHRKGYRGSAAPSIWHYDKESREFTLLIEEETGAHAPLWRPDGESYYYVSERDGTWNIWLHNLREDTHRQRTFFEDDGVRDPSLSADGRVMVFNRGVDLWVWHPESGEVPAMIPLYHHWEDGQPELEVRQIRGTSDADFSKSGLEIAFASEGRLFIMDTILRRPNLLFDRSDREYSSPRFSPDGRHLHVIEDTGEHRRLIRLERADPAVFWWKARSFDRKVIAGEEWPVHSYQFSHDKKKLAWMEGNGRLMVGDQDGGEPRLVHQSWEPFSYDWSPDGRWMAVATRDPAYNRDIHIVSVDGQREPYNLSRHPGNEWSPSWSPDGRIIAFLGQRSGGTTQIHLAHLSMEDHLRTETEMRRAQALEKMRDDPWYAPDKNRESAKIGEPYPDEEEAEPKEEEASGQEKPAQDKNQPFEIDFDGLHERILTLNTGEGTPFRLFWSHDSKHLWFQTTTASDRAVYQIEPRSDARRSRFAQHRGIPLRVENANDSYWIVEDAPAKLSRGRLTSYSISTDVIRHRGDHLTLGFLLGWRTVRDRFYDPGLNDLDWDEVREKYQPLAAAAANSTEFAEVMQMMFGELNASHMGFAANTWPPTGSSPDTAFRVTRHSGLRWEKSSDGRVMVKQVIPGTPAHAARPPIQPGDQLLEVDGEPVQPGESLARFLNGHLDEDLRLLLRPAASEENGNEPEPVLYRLRSLSPEDARELGHADFLAQTRSAVESMSGGRLGYIHIDRMRQENLEQFQHQVFVAGYGREGLVIDVRANRGGSITDHLLTILTQPRHAVTVTRDGQPGYPARRTVHGYWHKPIVVLIDEVSYSNAEIFAHAVQKTGRGQLVGRPTGGGVISTLRESLLDLGRINVPFRGWFHGETGLDMELGPPIPDHWVDALPGDLAAGVDRQLEKAVEVLLEEIDNHPPQPWPEPLYRREAAR